MKKEEFTATDLRYGIIELTSHCQLACPGCYMVRRNKLNKQAMTLSEAVRILDLCREYRGGQDLESMDLLGGDPLLWPYLKDYISILLGRGIKPWIFTNMLAINKDLTCWLFERQVAVTGKLNINPSDSGQLALQAKLIGRSEKVAKQMLAAIEIFRAAGYREPLFRLQNLIRRDNLALIPDYYRWCLNNNIGADLELMGSGEEIDERYWSLAPTPPQLAELIRKIQAIRMSYDLPEMEVLMPHLFSACPFYDHGLYFDVLGGIRACSNSTVALGSIFDSDPIHYARQSELICERCKLTKSSVGAPCDVCDKWERCRGGCRATAEGSGNYLAGYSLCPVPYL